MIWLQIVLGIAVGYGVARLVRRLKKK